jgi:hypothetical protein
MLSQREARPRGFLSQPFYGYGFIVAALEL